MLEPPLTKLQHIAGTHERHVELQLQEYVICSHIRKFCSSLRYWIVWTYIFSDKVVERGWVVHVTYIITYWIAYLLQSAEPLISQPFLRYISPIFSQVLDECRM